MKTPKRMNKQELLDYFSKQVNSLLTTQKTLINTLDLRNQDLRATQTNLYAAQEEWEKERQHAITIRRALEAETHGLRRELAQAQSALYTLINKLPLGN